MTWGILFWFGLIKPAMAGETGHGEFLIGGMMPVAVMFAASVISLVGVSLLTQPPAKEVVDRFFIPRGQA